MNPLFYSCKKCDRIYCVAADDPGRHLLKKVMRCPNFSNCNSNIREVTRADTKKAWSSSTAIQLYQASMGAGLPEERKCGPADVKKTLVGQRITAVEVEDSPDPARAIIRTIKLTDGKVVHLGTSTRGATVYKISEDSNVG